MASSRAPRGGAWLRALPVALAIGLVASACVTITSGGGTAPSESAAVTSSPGPTVEAATPGADASPSDASLAPASDPPPTVPPRSIEPSIGYISLDASLLYDQAVSSGVSAAATDAGVAFVECDPGWTRDRVIECATQLAQAGVHGVISFQPFADLAPDICAITGDAPTVGVVFDQGSCQVSQLHIDQAASGRLAGEAVGAFAEERWGCDINAYISLESSDDDPDGRARMQGYRDGFITHCPMPDRSITLDGADRLLTAQTQVSDLLEDLKGKPNVVVGLNDNAILGAMAAATAVGRENQFWYGGQLADPAIRQHIACDERYIASVAQFPERFGEAMVPTLLGALAGEEVPEELVAELELVTSANVRALFPDTVACEE